MKGNRMFYATNLPTWERIIRVIMASKLHKEH